MTYILVVGSVFFIAFLVRIFPHLMFHQGVGVDYWFWRAYIETYRRNKQFPPVLPQYILEEHQWYPPLFPLLVSYLPEVIFDRYNHYIAVLIDLLCLGLLLIVANWLSNGNMYVIGTAGLIYATTPILISYNIQLNPRGLGALFLDATIFLFIWIYLYNAPVWVWGIILFLSSLILLTHKMTTQLFWFLCLVASILLQDWRLLALIPASILSALLISKGFYWKVMRAHWDIVTFWNRNWRWLQAHPIKESPIYGEKDYETPTKFHQKGLKGFLRHIRYLFGYNPGIWIFCFLVIIITLSSNDASLSFNWILWWSLFTILFAILTVFVPFLKCLGSGYFYLYNAAFPSALLWGLAINNIAVKNYILLAFPLALITNLFAILFFYRKLKSSKIQTLDNDFEKVINYLKKGPKGVVMCLPPQWYDIIAYKTGQPVLFGGHGYGFKLLEPTFPRLLLSIQEIVKRYNIRYLVTYEGYLPDNFMASLNHILCSTFGPYKVFTYDYTPHVS